MNADALRRDYAVTFLRFLPAADEAALTAAYELGRACLAAGTSVHTLVRVHHDVLVEVLDGTPAAGWSAVVEAAGDFLAEVLTPVDLARRAVTEGADTADTEG
jgi:hypothetical protein